MRALFGERADQVEKTPGSVISGSICSDPFWDYQVHLVENFEPTSVREVRAGGA